MTALKNCFKGFRSRKLYELSDSTPLETKIDSAGTYRLSSAHDYNALELFAVSETSRPSLPANNAKRQQPVKERLDGQLIDNYSNKSLTSSTNDSITRTSSGPEINDDKIMELSQPDDSKEPKLSKADDSKSAGISKADDVDVVICESDTVVII